MEELTGLRKREAQWRESLVGRALVMEANVSRDDAMESFRWLGNRYGKCDNRDERNELLAKFRAIFLIGLTAVGGRDYDEGTFWPHVSTAFGVTLTQSDIEIVSTRYKQILTHYGLRRFTTPMANVGEVLMHAGVPVSSIEGFLRLLVKQDRRGSGTSGAFFAAWARSQNRQSASMVGLDAPTWRFLREGGEVAEDFVDRCLVAFDAATTGGVLADVGLSQHIVDEIARLVENGALIGRPGRGARAREVAHIPLLVWDGAAGGVAIVLPALEVIVEETVNWILTSEGYSASYSAEPPWPGVAASTITHSLPRPTKAVSVRARPGVQEWDVSVVDPDDPMLIFDASSGAIIPARNSLPPDRVVIGVPRVEGREWEGLVEFDGQYSTSAHHESPFGWESWAFFTVDLAKVRRARRGEDRWRFVSTSTRPQVTYPETLLATTTIAGLPIFTDLPDVILPAVDATSTKSLAWAISCEEESTGRTLWSTAIQPERDPQNVTVWPERTALLLGKYVIVVRGALGRGITRRFSIAEGWKATVEPSFRYLTTEGQGLEPATATMISGRKNVQAVSLDRNTASAPLTLEDTTGVLEAIVRVPHMSIAVSRAGSLPVVTFRPQSIDVESLGDTEMRVSVPVGLRATLGLVAADRVEQIIDGGISSDRAYVNFNIRQFADTGRSLRSGLLQLRIGDRSVPVGTLRPRKLADKVHFDAETGALCISPGAPEGLRAAIYPRYAPWEAPTVVSFATGATAVGLAQAATEIGGATVMLRIDDPWSPTPWPALPFRNDSNVFPLTFRELHQADDSSEGGFARWLAGLGDIPASPRDLPLAAKILSLLGTFESARPYKKLRTEISAVFEAYPALFIDTVMHVPLDPTVLMRLVVDSNLAAIGSEIPPPVPGSWPLNSFLGLIGDYEGAQEDSDPQFISNLENFAGLTALTVLDTGADPDARIGRFDDNTRILHTFPEDRLEQIWAAASPVPGRLLQKDTRMIAARQLFDVRNSHTLRDLLASSASILTRTSSTIHGVFGPEGELPVVARIGSDGWRNLPALSMALAIISRLAARDLGNSRGIYSTMRSHYAQLAEAAPAFVEQDLVIAELWIMNGRNEWTR